LWHLATDTIEAGQWFKGRMYERRCDLSPAGDRLVYFAASFHQPLYSWTAISRPPYLTALALLPKGDCWGGGGLFHTHGICASTTDPTRFSFPPASHYLAVSKSSPLAITLVAARTPPIMSMRMIRDGWIHVPSDGEIEPLGRWSRYSWRFDPPLTIQNSIDSRGDVLLRKHLHAIHERQARCYVETADLANQEGRTTFEFGRIDWMDLDHNGDTLYAKDGCLFRLARPVSHHTRMLLMISVYLLSAHPA
jgi:hypothetical protein